MKRYGLTRPTSRRSLTLAVLLIAASGVCGQETSQYDQGTPPQHAAGLSPIGSYLSADLGTVNLSNGSLNFKIPLGSVGGRGFSLPLTLNYSSKVWSANLSDTLVSDPNPHTEKVSFAVYDDLAAPADIYQRVAPGWTVGAVPMLKVRGMGLSPVNNPNGCEEHMRVLVKLTLILPDRGEIELRDDQTDGAPLGALVGGGTACRWMDGYRGRRWHATDGSGIVFINDVDNGIINGNLNGVVITAEGMRYRFNDSTSYFGGSTNLSEFARAISITDRNGNMLQISYPSGSAMHYTDQLGRLYKVEFGVNDPVTGQPLAVLITLPGFNGSLHYYKIKTE